MKGMDRPAVLLIIVIFLVLAIYSFAPFRQTTMSMDEAIALVKKDAQSSYPGASVTVLPPIGFSGNGSDAWKINIKITVEDPLNACCPKVFVRYYELMPLRFRSETITKGCTAGKPILYEEEAIIASGKSKQIENQFCNARGVKTSVLFFSAEKIRATKDCKECSLVESLVSDLPVQELWVVEWSYGKYSKLAAVNRSGDVLKVMEVV
ncbi:hypothetical protein HY991_02115 [Candidatus Micrarchaeota archaeon]|nr:hypothetical protein [Candidatus Micrarchaeota archaeon]